MYKKLLMDFLVGGILVALAVGIGIYINPVIGGIVAAAPMRAGASIFLGGLHESKEFAVSMTRGSLISYVGTLFFFIALFYTLPRFSLINSFVISSIVWVMTTAIIFVLSRNYL